MPRELAGKIMWRLDRYWEHHPDLTLCQLLSYIAPGLRADDDQVLGILERLVGEEDTGRISDLSSQDQGHDAEAARKGNARRSATEILTKTRRPAKGTPR